MSETTQVISTTLEKKRITRTNPVASLKWFKTADGTTIYSYIPRTMRTRKDEVANALKKKKVDVTILLRELSFKATGEKVNSYVITTRSDQFSAVFPSVESKVTNINLSPRTAKAEENAA